jgi:hypothetical protein
MANIFRWESALFFDLLWGLKFGHSVVWPTDCLQRNLVCSLTRKGRRALAIIEGDNRAIFQSLRAHDADEE